MFSPRVAASVSHQISEVRATTGEELVVVTVRRFPSAQADDAVEREAQRIYLQEGVRGTLVYVDRDDRRDAVVAQPAAWFTARRVDALKTRLAADFAAGAYDTGLERLAADVLAVYRNEAPVAPARAVGMPPRLRVYAVVAAAVLAYLLVAGALRRAGGRERVP